MKCKNIVVTGANSGIGLELVKQMLTRFEPDNLFATYRDPSRSKKLLKLAKSNSSIHLYQLDVTEAEKYAEFVEFVESATEGAGVNLLINNAGINLEDDYIDELDKDTLMLQYEVNTVAPILLSKAFLPLLQKAVQNAGPKTPMGLQKAVLWNMGCYFGSIADNKKATQYGFRISRTALHQATKNMSLELFGKGILVTPLNPGWVATKIGGPCAFMEPDSSVREILHVLENLKEDQAGRFFSYTGKETAW